MKRLHVHIGVENIESASAFYTALFGAEPALTKPDYAKWRLADPPVTLAISTSGARGVDHLGVDFDDPAELDLLSRRLADAGAPVAPQEGAHCCYASSDKAWTRDPDGVAWEAFHTLKLEESYGAHKAPDIPSCASGSCAETALDAANDGAACCG